MMFALDTETSGIDFRHGAKPFFVTTCDPRDSTDCSKWSTVFYEWHVDPYTREPLVPPEDIRELQTRLDRLNNWARHDDETRERHVVIGQNIKFDVFALSTVGITRWPWGQTRDTLLAGHLLASNRKHDLTSMAMQYLGWDILPWEMALQQATIEARRLCRRKVFVEQHGEWAIAKRDRPDMPSAKDRTWKFDSWLPRTVANYTGLPEPDPNCHHDWPDYLIRAKEAQEDKWLCRRCGGHRWWVVLADYSNFDSAATTALWLVMRDDPVHGIKARDLWEIYLERLKLVPIVYGMKCYGMTWHGERLDELSIDYSTKSAKADRICTNIAASRGYDLVMPKSGNNKSLLGFCFGERIVNDYGRVTYIPNDKCLNLPVIKKSEDTGAPSLDKYVLEECEATLPPHTAAGMFVSKLRGKRALDTACIFMESYKRFGLPLSADPVHHPPHPSVVVNWHVLYPDLNITGTDTLRFSGECPNPQNVSKRENFNLRYCFGPAPGREWWSLDYENIELRIPAYESGEEEMIYLFEHPEAPPYYGSKHFLIFDTLHPEKFAKYGKDCKKKFASTWYQWTKNGNFAIQYGAQEAKADATYHVKGAYKKIAARFAKQAALNQYWIRFANKHGYVETLPDKTVNPRRGYPILCTRLEHGGIKPTIPLSYHVQSTAMWCTSKAMVRCQEQLDTWNRQERRPPNTRYYMPLQVHDELVFDFPVGTGARPWETNLPKIKVIQKLMQQSGDDIGIPLRVAITYNPVNWSEGMGEDALKVTAATPELELAV